ncbi:MAG: MFS transporter [Amnibacterium sp.]
MSGAAPSHEEQEPGRTDRPDVRPLYAAGFVTAFGAHAVAATVGAESAGRLVLQLGLLIAVYDLAEVLLKPVFGALADRIGPRPVIAAGLLAFGAVSAVGAIWSGPAALIAIRFGQGAAASAFSPAASAAVARLATPERRGRAFGRYGSWKSLGYVTGPVLGSLLAAVGGIGLLQLVLAVLGFGVAAWALLRCPRIEPLPRARPTALDVLRESTRADFLGPVLLLAGAAGALVAGIGFLPAQAARLHAGVLGASAVASVLALALVVAQPLLGRWIDEGRLLARRLAPGALLLSSAGVLLAAWAPDTPVLIAGTLLLGLGVAAATPSGYAALAATASPERLGRTMGTAEMGRELGDAAAPALVGVVAAAAGLWAGLSALGVALVAAAALFALLARRVPARAAG